MMSVATASTSWFLMFMLKMLSIYVDFNFESDVDINYGVEIEIGERKGDNPDFLSQRRSVCLICIFYLMDFYDKW